MVLDQAIRFLAFDLGVKLLKTATFLVFAGIGIKLASDLIRKVASRKYREPVVVGLIADAGKLFMWFWAVLIALSILGFSESPPQWVRHPDSSHWE